MNNFEITKQDNAVEEYFCKPFGKLPAQAMNQDMTEFMMILLVSKNEPYEIPEKEKPGMMQLIEKRIKGCLTIEVTDVRLIVFLAYLCESPGKAVMYLAYLQYRCKIKNIKSPTLEQFCEMMPWGFPSEDDLQKAWDGQKVRRSGATAGSDNLLDYQTAYKSIQF